MLFGRRLAADLLQALAQSSVRTACAGNSPATAAAHGSRRRQDGRGAPRREPAPVRRRPPGGRRRRGGLRGERRDPRHAVRRASRRLAGLDIGPATRERFTGELRSAGRSSGTGRWGLRVGAVRRGGPARWTRAVAESSAYSVVGGGDSVRAVQEAGLAERISWISTGGGASLELLEGKRPSRRRRHFGGLSHADRRQLEDVQDRVGDARVLRRAARPPGRARGRRRRRLSAVHLARRGGRRARRDRDRRLRAERPLGSGGAVHRRGLAADAPRDRRDGLARRPLRAPAAVRRDGRDRGEAARGLLAAGLHAIACVGETEHERDAGETEAVLRRQVEAVRATVAEENLDRLAIAYEPVWAIGTGRTATPSRPRRRTS